jgi:RNA polymerase sigma-70 factor (ECF subfamily)
MNLSTAVITKPPDATLACHDDDVLVARLRERDLQALELVMRRYNQLLFRIARSILGDDDEAMDVVQETYVTGWYHLHQFKGTGSFSSWLCRIARNDAVTRRRKAERMEYSIDDPELDQYPFESAEAPPAEVLANQQLREMLEKAIDRLPLDYRCVYVLRAVQQLSTAETALSLDISEDLVKARFMRARRALQGMFEGHLAHAQLEVFEFAGRRCDAVVRGVLARLTN